MIKLSNYVGKTPLIPLSIGKYTVWGKAELMNPGGSVKDRMASFILNDAEEKNIIKKGDTLCEALLNFEEAKKIKSKIDLLKDYRSKSIIVSSKISNVDVFSLISNKESYNELIS